MDTVKIGKFLSELRREREMTQEQLAEKLGTSNKTISRWENGNYMPPVEMLMELSEFYGVSINEILSGKRLEQGEEKRAAEENLKAVLDESPFSIQEKKDYFTKKWKKEHAFEMTLQTIICAVLVILGLWLKETILTIAAQIGLTVICIFRYNRMMAYVERNVYAVEKDNTKKS